MFSTCLALVAFIKLCSVDSSDRGRTVAVIIGAGRMIYLTKRARISWISSLVILFGFRSPTGLTLDLNGFHSSQIFVKRPSYVWGPSLHGVDLSCTLREMLYVIRNTSWCHWSSTFHVALALSDTLDFDHRLLSQQLHYAIRILWNQPSALPNGLAGRSYIHQKSLIQCEPLFHVLWKVYEMSGVIGRCKADHIIMEASCFRMTDKDG